MHRQFVRCAMNEVKENKHVQPLIVTFAKIMSDARQSLARKFHESIARADVIDSQFE